MRRVLTAIAVLLVSTFVAGVAAQADGTLVVVIDQPTNATATIEIASAAEPARHWSTTASGPEPVTVAGLPPGTYHVIARYADGHAAESDVTLAAGEVVRVAPDAQRQRVVVVDRESASSHTTFDRRELRELPSGAGPWGLVDSAAPFVITDQLDTGGLTLGRPLRVGSRGGSWTETSVLLDGVPVASSPRGEDQLAFQPDLRALDGITIVGGTAPAAIGSPGATIALLLARPPSTPAGSVDVSITAPSMVGTNRDVAAPSIANVRWWRSGGVQFGGPLTPRAGLFVTGSVSALAQQQRGVDASTDTTVTSGLAHLVTNVTDRQQLRVVGAVQRMTRPFDGRPAFRSSSLTERDTFVQTDASWQQFSPSGRMFEAGAAYQHSGFVPSGPLPSGASVDRVFDGPMPALPANEGVNRVQLRASSALVAPRGHAVRVGATVTHTAADMDLLGPPAVAELVNGQAARVWIPESLPAPSRRSMTEAAAFLDDRIDIGAHLTANLGLRLEHSTGAAAGADQSVSWTAALPRARLRWAPSAISVFVAYGQYQRPLTLPLLAFGDPGEPVLQVYRWDDVNANGVYDSADTRVLVARAGTGQGVASIDPALRGPRLHEFAFGAERRLGALAVSAVGVVRREQSLIQSVNVGVPASAYLARTVSDTGSTVPGRTITVYERAASTFGADRFVLSNVSGEDATYDGVEIRARYDGPRWWATIGASAYRAEGSGGNIGFRADENDPGVVGDLLADPNANTSSRGRLFADRGYVLKWATGVNLPAGFHGAFVARYQDGQPFARLILVPGLAQGPQLVRAAAPGTTRFTFTTTVDARIEKTIAMGSRSLALQLDAYNLTNLGNEVEENPISGPLFRDSTAIQPPVTVRFGLRFAF